MTPQEYLCENCQADLLTQPRATENAPLIHNFSWRFPDGFATDFFYCADCYERRAEILEAEGGCEITSV